MNTSRNPLIIVISLSLLFPTKEAEGFPGGNIAMPGWFQYQVSVQRNNEPWCGGAIIGDRFVLTAAHCIVDSDMKIFDGSYNVLANEIDLSNVKRSAIKVEVEKFYIPTDYRPDLAEKQSGYILTGDIAVLKLKTKLGLDRNPSIKKVELPRPEITYQGVRAVVSGFGIDHVASHDDVLSASQVKLSSSNKLHYTMANVISNKKCQKIYGSTLISSHHLCGRVDRRGKSFIVGTCGSDIGGPLVHKNTIIGVISTNSGSCAQDNNPRVLTRVSSYLKFIKKAMADNSDVKTPVIFISV